MKSLIISECLHDLYRPNDFFKLLTIFPYYEQVSLQKLWKAREINRLSTNLRTVLVLIYKIPYFPTLV